MAKSLIVRGIARDPEDSAIGKRTIQLYFNRKPSDKELLAFYDRLSTTTNGDAE